MSIEEEFFKTFGIEPKKYQCINDWEVCPPTNPFDCPDKCEGCKWYQEITPQYPPITDRILLELICILNTVTVPDLGDINYVRLKMQILQECIDALTKVDWENREPTKEEFIDEVRSLFEGVEE